MAQKEKIINTIDGVTINSTPIKKLNPFKKNARVHKPKQVNQIANSFVEFGMNNPILIKEDYTIVAGHGRVLAAKQLGMKEIPTICINHLSEEQVQAFIIADNKIAENAEWDYDILAEVFADLSLSDIDFELEVIGFETEEIDLIIEGEQPDDDSADELPDIDEDAEPITKLGDIIQLGKHILVCGDSTVADIYNLLMKGELAQAIITDPPYNLGSSAIGGLGKIKHKNFVMGFGEMDDDQFIEFLRVVCRNMVKFSCDGSLHYIFMDWRHIYELLHVGRSVYTELKNICVWNKNNAGMRAGYRSKQELCPIFKNGTGKHINNINLGKYGNYRTNVWDYAGVNTMRKGRMEELAMHPTVKPVAMIADAIKDCTRRNQIVLDPFSGSGTVLIGCERTGRACAMY